MIGQWKAFLASTLVLCMAQLAPSARSALAAQGSADGGAALEDLREVHLTHIRQLTFEGENAEAYFSFDGTRLTFQSTPREGGCDQIYTMDLDGGNVRPVSSGGRTTCSYFYPAGDKILYSSTHHWSDVCPVSPDFSQGYVWALYPTYDIFVGNADGSDLLQLTDSFGYDAEATFSPMGDRVVFTSMRDGDLELYSMNGDGSDVQRLTYELGYDGGAFYSPDGSKIVWRADRPGPEQVQDYKDLLAQGLIRPTRLELFVMDADGSQQRQITELEAASFAPYWHPSSEKIIFSSNHGDPAGREFELFMINIDGTALEQVTFSEGFDGFPVFSPDGRYLVWASNRNPSHEGNTNIFIAEWVEEG